MLKNSKKILCIFFLWLAVTNAAYSQEEADKALRLEEFIKQACQKDTVFQQILIDGLALKYEKALQLPAADLVMSLEGQYDFLYRPDYNDPESSISLSKLFPYTGTEVEAGYSSSLAVNTRRVTSDFTVKVSQPIAQNAFGKNTRLLEKIVGLEIEVAKHQIIEAYEDYLAALTRLYYDWYSAYENLKTGQNSYNENMKLLENIKEREKNKIALPIDTNKLTLQVIAKEENLISLRNSYESYLNLIKEAIRYEGIGEFFPQDSSLYAELKIMFEKDYERFKQESRTSQVLFSLEKKSLIEIDKYADELLPSINIFAGYSLDGTQHDLGDKEKMAFVGASFDWPFPGQVETAEYETTKIDSKKTFLSSESTRVQLYTKLKNIHIAIEREKKLIGLSEDKIKLARSIVNDETENYSLGRATLNDLIDEINKLEDNKFSKISHQIQLKKLTIEWLRLSDSLVAESD
ncbi:MAG: TolC family protein, partial [Candidatus Omnitrophota bacterium]